MNKENNNDEVDSIVVVCRRGFLKRLLAFLRLSGYSTFEIKMLLNHIIEP